MILSLRHSGEAGRPPSRFAKSIVKQPIKRQAMPATDSKSESDITESYCPRVKKDDLSGYSVRADNVEKPVVLTGDRTTGHLHMGHYLGSLRNRIALQESHRQFVLLADAQALTDSSSNPAEVARNVTEVSLDYLAVGLDPTKTTICLQSQLPTLSELTMLYLNFVSVARLERNPTVKEEIRTRALGTARGVR